jgi:hypothetical protein
LANLRSHDPKLVQLLTPIQVMDQSDKCEFVLLLIYNSFSTNYRYWYKSFEEVLFHIIQNSVLLYGCAFLKYSRSVYIHYPMRNFVEGNYYYSCILICNLYFFLTTHLVYTCNTSIRFRNWMWGIGLNFHYFRESF